MGEIEESIYTDKIFFYYALALVLLFSLMFFVSFISSVDSIHVSNLGKVASFGMSTLELTLISILFIISLILMIIVGLNLNRVINRTNLNGALYGVKIFIIGLFVGSNILISVMYIFMFLSLEIPPFASIIFLILSLGYLIGGPLIYKFGAEIRSLSAKIWGITCLLGGAVLIGFLLFLIIAPNIFHSFMWSVIAGNNFEFFMWVLLIFLAAQFFELIIGYLLKSKYNRQTKVIAGIQITMMILFLVGVIVYPFTPSPLFVPPL